MFDPTVPDPVATRLWALLQEPACELGEEAVAEARSIGPEAAADVVASLLEAERTRPTASRAGIRAVHLAHACAPAAAGRSTRGATSRPTSGRRGTEP